jgi:hypothetical protein
VNIETRITPARGCGHRKPGGLYLVAGAPSAPCGKLPLELSVCPCCGQGIKFSRGWTWVDADRLFKEIRCLLQEDLCGHFDQRCPAATGLMGRAGLIWVGEKFYPKTSDFTAEAAKMGISRRIKSIPHGFELGKTWVLFAHIRAIVVEISSAIPGDDQRPFEAATKPGVFMFFRPTAIEYVVKGTESEDELRKIADRGITLVKDILPAGETTATPATDDES